MPRHAQENEPVAGQKTSNNQWVLDAVCVQVGDPWRCVAAGGGRFSPQKSHDDGFSLIVKGTPQCDFLGGVRLFGMLEECSKNSCRNR